VRLVLAAAVTKLLELETARGRLFVLRRRVVALFALGALQCNDFPHAAILTDPAPDSWRAKFCQFPSFQLSEISFI
jgi:hypothetical protein